MCICAVPWIEVLRYNYSGRSNVQVHSPGPFLLVFFCSFCISWCLDHMPKIDWKTYQPQSYLASPEVLALHFRAFFAAHRPLLNLSDNGSVANFGTPRNDQLNLLGRNAVTLLQSGKLEGSI